MTSCRHQSKSAESPFLYTCSFGSVCYKPGLCQSGGQCEMSVNLANLFGGCATTRQSLVFAPSCRSRVLETLARYGRLCGLARSTFPLVSLADCTSGCVSARTAWPQCPILIILPSPIIMVM